MIQLEKDLPQFKYHIVLSRETWNNKQGYVHSVYEEFIQEYFSQIEDNSYNGLDIEFFIGVIFNDFVILEYIPS